MKKFMKIGALSLALIASLLVLSNTTNAAQQTGNVSLKITTTSGSCTYATSLYIGEHTGQYAAYDMTGSNFSGEFECVDTEGLSGFTMTMQASSPLRDGTAGTGHDIPANNVSMMASTNFVSAGTCTTGTNQNTWAAIGTDPKTILHKAGVEGDICSVKSSVVNLAVHIDANQAVGVYTGELTLVMPF